MDDIDDDAIARYPSNPYGVGYPNNQGYGYLKHPLRNSSYSHSDANESTRDYDHVDDEDRLGGNDDEDQLGGNDDDDVVDEDRLGGNDDDVVDEDRIGGNDDVVVVDDDDDDDDDQHSQKQADEDDDSGGGGDENDDDDRQSEEYGYLKDSVRNSPYSQPFGNEGNNDEDEEDEERLVEEDDDDDVDIDQNNNVQLSLNHANEEDSNDEDGDKDENVDDNDGDNDNKQESYAMMNEDELEWRPKKQKLKSLMSTYEFAARVPTPSAAKRSFGVRNSLTEWTEKETFVLLDAWGDRFLQHRRKSLRSEEWQQVAEKVSVVSKVERTGTQCRNRLDTLKKKYKKDKIKFQGMGGGDRKWVYFQKMDKLMSSPPQQARLSCRSNSRERIFMKPEVYVNHANEMDDMKDSPPENTESVRVEGFEGPRPKKRRKGRGSDESSSFKLLADSIQNFGKIYEKIENSKRQQMMELEKMRMDFLNDLEAQKRQIFERLQSEILKIEQRDD